MSTPVPISAQGREIELRKRAADISMTVTPDRPIRTYTTSLDMPYGSSMNTPRTAKPPRR
nr:hypothetical protein GCM10020093_037040 [Planobispora longispora]